MRQVCLIYPAVIIKMNMEEIEIREAVLTDVESLNVLYAQVDQKHHDEHPELFKPSVGINRPSSFFEGILNDDSIKFLVACLENKIIGFIHAEIKSTNHPVLQSYSYGHITDIVVNSDYRRTGVGSELFKTIEVWFKEHEIKEISLTVFSFNEEALSFYINSGFTNRHCTMVKSI